jgi:hypothetical protein
MAAEASLNTEEGSSKMVVRDVGRLTAHQCGMDLRRAFERISAIGAEAEGRRGIVDFTGERVMSGPAWLVRIAVGEAHHRLRRCARCCPIILSLAS